MKLPVLFAFTRQDFIDRYSGSVFGALWSFIHPLVMIFIFTVVFAKIMGARLPGSVGEYNYPVYLVSGLLPWIAFSTTITRCATVFIDKRHIIGKIYLNLGYLPLYIVFSETITFTIALALFLGFLVFVGQWPGQLLLLVGLIYLLQQIFAFGLGLLFAILNVFLRDIRELVGIGLTFWFWLTPIVWVPDIAPRLVQDLQHWLNPAYLFIGSYRSIFVDQQLPASSSLAWLAGIGFAVVVLAWRLLRWLEKDIRDFL
ncbi:ABC transporter permease [Thiorhodovibrio frisius]|uniref:Transport permease protein n=1 Tax=Thiorhodovibrio frisius TaxID=631362 RepID=H8Z1T4_9GAMM|nr:ABC transporter permease [Thiorhodovibrio frisius]EIC22562.1 ABC-type polysaccharide/polyol phosphate export system, permease component [Thiorhodovibrio frisius]WPL20003.1 Teichoic acid translocation permease protein TagG [Thiorhodovibrio frisius]